MKHEALVRHIEAAGPEQLRALARLVLELSGYATSRTTDGPYDGGIDVVTGTAAGSPLPMAVAVSIENDWRKKLSKDVAAARQDPRIKKVLYISSRRIPEGSFRTVQKQLEDTSGIHVDRIDQQGIADLVMDHEGALARLLEILDLPTSGIRLPTTPEDRRRDAMYAYAFFAPEVHDFHKAIRDRSLVVALAQAGGSASIADLCGDAARLIGIDDKASMSLLLNDIDRLRQAGRIQGPNGTVVLAADERETMAALGALRQREEASLRELLLAHVDAAQLEPREDALDVLWQGLGPLLARHIGAPTALDDLRSRVRRLQRELQSHGLREGDLGDQFIAKAISLANDSELGRSLAAGSIYRALMRLDRGGLLRALDATSMAIVVDASVAIPMLCSLFHGSVDQRFFLVAEEFYRRSRQAGIVLQLPDVWLEEMASHLLRAPDYEQLLDDPDLRDSGNAYVAYFVASERVDFVDYLAQFGLTESLRGRDRIDARRAIETFLRRQLDHYGIEIVSTGGIPKQHIDRAQRNWTWTCHELGVDAREPILVEHDVRVLAWLAAHAERDPSRALMVATWDRVIRRARPESDSGGALDPLAIGELLSFVAGDRAHSMTARFASLLLTEAEAEHGARILDALVHIERERLSDAHLVQQARAFKQDYVRKREEQPSAKALGRAWETFKRRPA